MNRLNDTGMVIVLGLPPVVFTAINCYYEGWSAIGFILIFFLLWMLIIIPILILIDNYDIQRDEKKQEEIVRKGLRIPKNTWDRFSSKSKEKMEWYYSRQESFIRYFEEIPEDTFVLDELRKRAQESWDKLSFEERIARVDRIEKAKEEERLQVERERKEREEKRQQELKAAEERERRRLAELEAARLERLQKENELRMRKEMEMRRAEEERKRKERERLKEMEIKERLKKEILEKERRRQLEQEAIEELIAAGKIGMSYTKNYERQPIPSVVKQIVWSRDGQQCVTCGSRQELEFDHIIPVSKGGSNDVGNIQLLCLSCNRRKSNKIV